jgi:2-methylcitrate dehydratase PrpD
MTSSSGTAMHAVTRLVAAWIAETRLDDLPERVVHETARILLDSIGCAVAAHATDKSRIVVDIVRALGGCPESTVLGAGFRTSCANAAFANAELVNTIDFDAVFLNISHIVPPIVPAGLALAERGRVSGRELLAALALGLELGARLTMALLPVAVSPSGAMVVDPVWGYGFAVLGVAAAASRILHLPADGVAHALGIAAYCAPSPGLLKWTRTTPMSMIKYSPMGWTAQAGVQAALLAAQGFTGDTTVLDGPDGFWRFWGAPQCRWMYLSEDWGSRWYSVEYLSFKLYPVCNLYRPHLWLLDRLMCTEALKAKDLEEVRFRTGAVAAADRPYRGEAALSEISVHNSAEFGAALVAFRVPPGPQWVVASSRANPIYRAFARRVRVMGNPTSAEAGYHPETGSVDLERLKDAGAGVEVRAQGKTWTLHAGVAKGDCWAPADAQMSDQDLAAKFRENCSGRLPSEQIEAMIDLVLSRRADIEDVSTLGRLAAGVPRP